MSEPAVQRPRLPSEFHRLVQWKVFLYLSHAFLFFVVPAALASFVFSLELPAAVRWPVLILLGLTGGHGLQLLAFAAHDGLHINLHRNKYVSMVMAIACSSLVPFFLVVGYSVTHWNHHRFTNQASDPDAEIFSRYKTFWSRLLFGRPKGLRMFMRNALRLAFGLRMPFKYQVPFSENEMRWLSRLNLLMSLGWLSSYVILLVRNPPLGVVCVVIPYLGLYIYTCLRAYIEHAGTGVGLFRDTRSYVSPLYTALFYGGNFHLEHHLYPGVPSYNLPAVHRYLQGLGILAKTGALIDPTVFGVLKYMTSRYAYPDPKEHQDVVDSFIEERAAVGGRLDDSGDAVANEHRRICSTVPR